MKQTQRDIHPAKVVGIGGLGKSVVEFLLPMEIPNLEFLLIDSDEQALDYSSCRNKVYLLSRGRGESTQAQMEIIRQLAWEKRDDIAEALGGAKTICLVAGIGGTTGTAVVPVLAELSKELGIRTICIVTRPFSFEGLIRHEQTERDIEALSKVADNLIVMSDATYDTAYNVQSVQQAFDRMQNDICQLILRLNHAGFDPEGIQQQ